MAEYWQQLTNGGGAGGRSAAASDSPGVCNGAGPEAGTHSGGNNNYVNFNQFIMQLNLGGGAPNAANSSSSYMQHPLESGNNMNFAISGGGGAFGLNPPMGASNTNNFEHVSSGLVAGMPLFLTA